MQLKNDLEGRNALRDQVRLYYQAHGERSAINFLDSQDQGFFYAHFLVDRKHVIRYGIGEDRRLWIGGVSLAIGPHYFSPADFWDYPNSQRFKIEASSEALIHNLTLLDEFLGYEFSNTGTSMA